MFSRSVTIRSSGAKTYTSVTLEPLFSTASSMWPAGKVFLETSHASSVAVTWSGVGSPWRLLFSAQPVTAVSAAAPATAVTTEERAARIQAPGMLRVW